MACNTVRLEELTSEPVDQKDRHVVEMRTHFAKCHRFLFFSYNWHFRGFIRQEWFVSSIKFASEKQKC